MGWYFNSYWLKEQNALPQQMWKSVMGHNTQPQQYQANTYPPKTYTTQTSQPANYCPPWCSAWNGSKPTWYFQHRLDLYHLLQVPWPLLPLGITLMHVSILLLDRAIPNLDPVIDKKVQLHYWWLIAFQKTTILFCFNLYCIEVQKFKNQSNFYDIIVAVNCKYNLLKYKHKKTKTNMFPPLLKIIAAS